MVKCVLKYGIFSNMNTPENINLSALIQNFDPKKEFTQPMLIIYLPLTFIFGVTIIFLQRICRPVRKIKIGRINSLRVGHMLLEIDFYLTKHQKPDLDLFFFLYVKPSQQLYSGLRKKRDVSIESNSSLWSLCFK